MIGTRGAMRTRWVVQMRRVAVRLHTLHRAHTSIHTPASITINPTISTRRVAKRVQFSLAAAGTVYAICAR